MPNKDLKEKSTLICDDGSSSPIMTEHELGNESMDSNSTHLVPSEDTAVLMSNSRNGNVDLGKGDESPELPMGMHSFLEALSSEDIEVDESSTLGISSSLGDQRVVSNKDEQPSVVPHLNMDSFLYPAILKGNEVNSFNISRVSPDLNPESAVLHKFNEEEQPDLSKSMKNSTPSLSVNEKEQSTMSNGEKESLVEKPTFKYRERDALEKYRNLRQPKRNRAKGFRSQKSF